MENDSQLPLTPPSPTDNNQDQVVEEEQPEAAKMHEEEEDQQQHECGIYDTQRILAQLRKNIQQEEKGRRGARSRRDSITTERRQTINEESEDLFDTTDEELPENEPERQERGTDNIDTMGTNESGTDYDNLDCEPVKRVRNIDGGKQSPWKVISDHTRTRRKHYHIIYISTAKNWGHNSKLGKAIRSKEYKCTSVACIECLVEYITTGINRKTYRNILEQSDFSLFKCVAHQLGLIVNPENHYTTADAQRRIGIHQELPGHSEFNINTIDDRLYGIGDQGRKARNILTNSTFARQNQGIVLLLCENKAFDEGEAQKLLCATPAGIAMQFIKGFDERLKTAVQIAKTLVFQEAIKQRFERSKALALRRDPKAGDFNTVYEGVMELESHLTCNDINHYNFARDTRRHFYGLTGKKNNLFFFGSPSTGKTLVMNSLVEMHYNYCILTGLQPTSPFNFSNTYMRNACFMDECKLTDNQFEQWKLLAGRQPMNTDMKYKGQHIVTKCILYTASNYEIGAYLQLNCNDAINERTIQYNFVKKTYPYKLNPFIWNRFGRNMQTNLLHRRKTHESTTSYAIMTVIQCIYNLKMLISNKMCI